MGRSGYPCPATADLIARLAAGMANDLVTTICLATPAPVAVVPAMNQQMYRNAATQHNLDTLASRGLLIWGPDSGSGGLRRRGARAYARPINDC